MMGVLDIIARLIDQFEIIELPVGMLLVLFFVWTLRHDDGLSIPEYQYLVTESSLQIIGYAPLDIRKLFRVLTPPDSEWIKY